MYITCRIFNGPGYVTKTRIRWGMRNPSWNHRSIFSIPPDHAGWNHHLSSNSMVLEVWDRPVTVPAKTATYNTKHKNSGQSSLTVDTNDRLVGIATIPLRNHLGFDLAQLASPYTPYPIRDVVSGRNAGFVFLDASVGPFQHIHSLFKLHAVRILQRTWRKKLQKNLPPPILPPLPDGPSTPPTSYKGKRTTAPVQTTPAPRRTAPSTLPHITTTNILPHQAILSINVLQAKLHSNASLPKSPNIFVVYALPAGIGEPQATCIRYSTSNPIWNHSYSTQLALDQRTVSILHQPHKYVTFEVWHKCDLQYQHNKEAHEALLGSAELPLASLLDASKRSLHTRASVDIYSPPPTARPIGTLEIEFSLVPSSSALPEHLTSSHEWVINTLTKYRGLLDPTHPTDNSEDRDKSRHSDQRADDSTDSSEYVTEIHDTRLDDRSYQNFHDCSQVIAQPSAREQRAERNHSDITSTTASEWEWLTELDKELSIQTDIMLKTRHAKNMLELDALLSKLNSSEAHSSKISFILTSTF
jgi:hypothetical protein